MQPIQLDFVYGYAKNIESMSEKRKRVLSQYKKINYRAKEVLEKQLAKYFEYSEEVLKCVLTGSMGNE